MRFIFLLIAMATAFTIYQTPGYMEPPRFLESGAEVVNARFGRCGSPLWPACVSDGDTFRLGERRIRIVGIDTAEMDAACEAEAAMAEASTVALREWLNRGPFTMTARADAPTDRYGRELRTIRRTLPDGSEENLADWMRQNGGARGYWGEGRGGWC
ncbi:hypothetical protein [Altererythrobacter lauratis]|uniref:Thermonuclease family protein n=1 Tax=Alteraurantiacibacter lauratis TaxID=2054627 RepID=A0ABV7EE31_9SPHN